MLPVSAVRELQANLNPLSKFGISQFLAVAMPALIAIEIVVAKMAMTRVSFRILAAFSKLDEPQDRERHSPSR